MHFESTRIWKIGYIIIFQGKEVEAEEMGNEIYEEEIILIYCFINTAFSTQQEQELRKVK